MKKILTLAVLLALVLPLCAAAADGTDSFTVNGTALDDGDVLSGVAEIAFYSPSAGESRITLDGTDVSAQRVNEPTFRVSTSSVDYKGSTVLYNGSSVGTVNSNGSFSFPVTGVPDGAQRLEIAFMPALVNGVFSPGSVYGTYNIDDMTLSAVSLELPSGEALKPSEVKMYYPVVNSAELTCKTVSYTSSVTVGDGWNASTGLGGSTPNTPVYCVFVFEPDPDNGSRIVTKLDTSLYSNGEHIIAFESGESTREIHIIIDNTPPKIVCDLAFNLTVSANAPIAFSATDVNGIGSLKAEVDGNEYKTGENIGSYTDDGNTHTLVVTATDISGNEAVFATQFVLSSGDAEKFDFGRTTTATTLVPEADTIIYALTELEAVPQVSERETVYSVSVASDAKTLILQYKGSVSTKELISLDVYDHAAGEYRTLRLAASDDENVIVLELEGDLIKDGKVTLREKPYLYESESDTFVWITDTQYYTRFDDLAEVYRMMTDYSASLFAEGKAGYFVHTGDVADEYTPLATGRKQMQVGSEMQKVLEEAGMPYGIVDGNHDVGQDLHDHSIFSEYFDDNRFDKTNYFYGDLDNNTSHYDLVTLGGNEFLFLYLGYGDEATPRAIAWANAVLSHYSSRNAIIFTHAYLDTDADWVIDEASPQAYTHSRAPEIWKNIVMPNKNVLAVMCGHTPGASRNLRDAGDGRFVWEILADYQYAETGREPCHVINNMTCDGEGYLRLVSFADGKMTQTTYSPLHDDYNFFADNTDTFTVDFALNSQRTSYEGELTVYAASAVADGVLAKGQSYVAAGNYTAANKGAGTPYGLIFAATAIVIIITAVVMLLLKKKKR